MGEKVNAEREKVMIAIKRNGGGGAGGAPRGRGVENGREE